jgi:hypothetical protein
MNLQILTGRDFLSGFINKTEATGRKRILRSKYVRNKEIVLQVKQLLFLDLET